MRQWAPGLRHVKAADRGAAVGSKTAAECPYLVHTGDKEMMSDSCPKAFCYSRATLTFICTHIILNTLGHYKKKTLNPWAHDDFTFCAHSLKEVGLK